MLHLKFLKRNKSHETKNKQLYRLIKTCEAIFTIGNHAIKCGFGSTVLELQKSVFNN